MSDQKAIAELVKRKLTSYTSTDGALHFHISIRLDVFELEQWSADRIAAFFDGIAKVVAADAERNEK